MLISLVFLTILRPPLRVRYLRLSISRQSEWHENPIRDLRNYVEYVFEERNRGWICVTGKKPDA
jgi:hypothetical protein